MKNTFHLISALQNGYMASKSFIFVPQSKHTYNFLMILKKYGFIDRITHNEKGCFRVSLKHYGEIRAISNIGRISRPSLPVYFSVKDLWKFHKSYGILILHTSRGLCCHHTALKQKLGGQLLCYIV